MVWAYLGWEVSAEQVLNLGARGGGLVLDVAVQPDRQLLQTIASAAPKR